MDEEPKGTVCVTGGTGFIASWLIKRLLQDGYSIRATIRPNPIEWKWKRDISYLTNLPGASERLEIVEANLNRPESFDAAIRGCSGVFHVAHPMDVTGREPEESVTRRAVEGTLGILRSCVRHSVRRVVYTSSAVTVLFSGDAGPADEDTWSDVEACKGFGDVASPSYIVSKTVVERTALEFAESHGLELLTLVLPLVVGPFVSPNLPSSIHIPLAMIFGEQAQYKHVVKFDMVHTDDVASAHIFLFESPNVKGRYICYAGDLTVHELFDILSAKCPEFHVSLPDDELKETKPSKRLKSFKSDKLLRAGFKFKYGIDQMLDDAIQCCKDRGFISSVISQNLTVSEDKV